MINLWIDKRVSIFKGFAFFISVVVCYKAFSTPADSLKKINIGALPSVFYSPETRLGMGGLFYAYFNLSKNDPLAKKSNTRSYISYTFNKQFAFENDYQIWLKKQVLLNRIK